MCRIFGYLDRAACPGGLRRLADMLHHGGPDGRYQASGPAWGIGVTRLAVMDPAGGRQPYALDNGNILAVFNGEIYNHRELRTVLEGHGYHFPDRCDGSIIPALYHRYGLNFVDRIDGMFAIAVLDLRAEPTLVLATDDSGMKPLYYSAGPGLCFASEPMALLEFPDVDRGLHAPAIDAYLTTRTPFGERTMFRGIRVLPARTTAVYSASTGLRIRERAAPPDDRTRADLTDAGRELRTLLSDETARLARADARVAAVCSGGLDSSLVTTLLRTSVPDLCAFHIGYRGNWPRDEWRYAQEVTARGRVRLHRIELDPATIPGLLPDVVRHLGQPNADPITVSTFALFQAIGDAGYKVALTGDAADEHFAGYDRMRTALSSGRTWISQYLDSMAAVPSWLRHRLYSDDYREYLNRAGDTASELTEAVRSTPGNRLAKITELEVRARLPAYHLRRVDHLSMSSAVEVRLPFCQRTITRFAATLADSLRVTEARGKQVLYTAAADLLPGAVLDRDKQPFTLPISAMLHEGGPLHRFVCEVLAPDEVRSSGCFQPHAVTTLLKEHARRPSGDKALAIWALAILHLWYRLIFMENLGMA